MAWARSRLAGLGPRAVVAAAVPGAVVVLAGAAEREAGVAAERAEMVAQADIRLPPNLTSRPPRRPWPVLLPPISPRLQLRGHPWQLPPDRKSTCLNSSHIPLSRMPS